MIRTSQLAMRKNAQGQKTEDSLRAHKTAEGIQGITELRKDAARREKVKRDLIDLELDEENQRVYPVQERPVVAGVDTNGDYQRWLAHKARLKESRKKEEKATPLRRVKVARIDSQERQFHSDLQFL